MATQSRFCQPSQSKSPTSRILNTAERRSDFRALNLVSAELESKAKVEAVLDGPNASKGVEEVVGKAFDVIDDGMREIMQVW